MHTLLKLWVYLASFKKFFNPTAIVTTETLNKLAKALGVPATELIEDVPDEEIKA